ncbi:MAG TPA: beta-ketoacyl synthase chain length factor [Rhodanobacteraceae bacterium]
MTAVLELRITGVGAWAPGAPDWMQLRGVLRGEATPIEDAPAHPAGSALPAAERRRAPDGVRLAADVAAQATAMAGIDPATLPCVFASTYGELAITDYVCETLARAPHELSPTKFHNSVLNAPAGYWTIATGCAEASNAVSAHHASFAAGLLEAAILSSTEATPVLFACGDVASTGPLIEMARTTVPFGAALVLVPAAKTGHGMGLTLALDERAATRPNPGELALPAVAGDNPANADALALLTAIARVHPTRLALRLSSALSLNMEITP